MSDDRKKPKINKKVDKAIQKMLDDIEAGKLIRAETVAALKVVIQWEAVKARIKGDDEYGSAFTDFDDPKPDGMLSRSNDDDAGTAQH